MKAIVFDEHGSIDVLKYRDIEEPDLQPGEVRVAVRACSLNYHDVFTRQGMPGIKVPLPGIPGCDCAGLVSEVADDVTGWSVGDRVLVDPVRYENGKLWMIGDTLWGAYAEYVVVTAEQLIQLPEDVSFDDASCLPVAYGTAHRMMLTRGSVNAGDSVLILGASGGVGTSALLLAKMRGASVIAAAGTDEKCKQLMSLGADETINYTTTDFVKYCREKTGNLFSGGGYDVVVNFTGGDTWARSLKCVKLGGQVLTCGATAGFDPPTDLRFIWTAEMDIRGSNGWQRSDLDQLLELTRTDEFSPVIDSRVPLNDGVAAHQALEERKFFGKIVINADAPI
ncbi:MAG TPA: zinc-binding dehydrogenase [Acidimicrobiaceae bacterium]|nr:zinc-binding dehydrogenase [Acidimicrobiaceae bacterium]|tara:strand:- start:193 stop:1206 length:1014 start_codon:yes stop_codon:yes gene_type:complete